MQAPYYIWFYLLFNLTLMMLSSSADLEFFFAAVLPPYTHAFVVKLGVYAAASVAMTILVPIPGRRTVI